MSGDHFVFSCRILFVCQDIYQLFGELAKWVRKRLHRASCIDDFAASLQDFLKVVHRPFERDRYVFKMNVIRDWKASMHQRVAL